jgi:hypothetical protein
MHVVAKSVSWAVGSHDRLIAVWLHSGAPFDGVNVAAFKFSRCSERVIAAGSDRIAIKYRNRSQNHENYPLDLQRAPYLIRDIKDTLLRKRHDFAHFSPNQLFLF